MALMHSVSAHTLLNDPPLPSMAYHCQLPWTIKLITQLEPTKYSLSWQPVIKMCSGMRSSLVS